MQFAIANICKSPVWTSAVSSLPGIILITATALVGVVGLSSTATAAETDGKVLRHVVLFSFKETSTDADIAKIVEAFRGLPAKIPQIKDFEWGTDVSPEGKAQGYTHCFFVTFASAADRDAYLPHPAHKDFVSIVGPHVEDVCVVDYWAKP